MATAAEGYGVSGLAYEDNGGRGLVIVSFDPGVTTGWAVHRLDLDALLRDGFVSTIYGSASGYVTGEILGDGTDASECRMAHAMLDIVRAAFSFGDYAAGDLFAVVMEDFLLRMQSGERSLLAPVRVFSRYEMLCDVVLGAAGVSLPYFKQQVSDAKQTVTDERLRRWGVYQPGSEHARDAQRHGILFARKVASVRELLVRLEKAAAAF